MRAQFIACCLVTSGCFGESLATGPATGGKGDVWGTDDRKERYEIETDTLRAAALSSGATFLLSDLEHDPVRDVWSAKTPTTLGAAQNLCEGQVFADQPVSAYCSATLITEDIMVSAGHCFDTQPCSDFAVVFDYAYEETPTDPLLAAKDIPAANVYKCAEMLAWNFATDFEPGTGSRGHDYAVFRLDRPVTGRTPAKVNWSDALTLGQPAYVIGHPSRIPQKMAIGSVIDTPNPDFVPHDADVFGGNSGGGLFDEMGTLIGIHVHSSAKRYVPAPEGNCNVVAVCGENATCDRKPHAYDPRRLKTELTPELQMQLGIPPAMP